MRYFALVLLVALVGCSDTNVFYTGEPPTGDDGGVCTPSDLLDGDYHLHLYAADVSDCVNPPLYYHDNIVIFRDEVEFLAYEVVNKLFCEEGTSFRVITGGMNTEGGLTYLLVKGDIPWETLPNVTQTIEVESYVNGEFECAATFDLVIEPG